MTFSPSEIEFMKHLTVLILIALAIRSISYICFIKTLSEKDVKLLESFKSEDNYVQSHKISKHSTLLVLIHYIMGFFIFVNSAIIGAMLLRSLV